MADDTVGAHFWPETMHEEWMDSSCTEDLVSVIIPTYNRAHLLPTTLDSVWQQTYRPIEVIVVDDGSTDETAAVVDQWKTKHEGRDFETHLLSQENSGAPAARNRGLIASTGEFIQYLDSDDVLHPLKLETQVASIRATSAGYAFSGVRTFSNTGEIPSHSTDSFASVADVIKKTGQTAVMNIPHLASRGLYKRSLVLNVGPWNEQLERWQDFEYNVRVSAQQVPFVETEGDFHFWRQHDSGRIEDFSGTNHGIELALRTLNAVESFLDRVDENAKKVPIKRPYLRVIREAMREGNAEYIENAIAGMKKQDLSTRQVFKLRLLRDIYRVAGGNVAIRAMKTYPKIPLF